MSIVDARLQMLLGKHGLSHQEFRGTGKREPASKSYLNDLRALIVTSLHESGVTWSDMADITGFGFGRLAKLTKAKGCAAALTNRRENMTNNRGSNEESRRQKLSIATKQRWIDGQFDFHKGRIRPQEERSRLKASWTSERRIRLAAIRKRLWQTTAYREGLVKIHRQNASRYSQMQAARMRANPEKWTWGRGAYVEGLKHISENRFWVRSSFEVAAVQILEQDRDVKCYGYEPRFTNESGFAYVPDFKVWMLDGSIKIIEIKASWVLRLPLSHRKQIRLAAYQEIASRNGFGFEIWTEKDKLHGRC